MKYYLNLKGTVTSKHVSNECIECMSPHAAVHFHEQDFKLPVYCFLSQIMLVDGYKGQKVQDVKKPIQKMMVERVRHNMFYDALTRIQVDYHTKTPNSYFILNCGVFVTFFKICLKNGYICLPVIKISLFVSNIGRGHDLHGARETGHVTFS